VNQIDHHKNGSFLFMRLKYLYAESDDKLPRNPTLHRKILPQIKGDNLK
jgi:hypothetical protein